jgi:hypothetical protein
MAIRSRGEVKDLIQFSCGIRKHDFAVYRSTPEPFIAIFHEEHDRDIVFAAGRALDGPVELAFHEWDIDRFGEREILPFQMRLCLEGIPQFAWCKEVADKVLGDEAFIHSVKEDTIQRVDHRAYNCWAICKDPSRIPQMVYLSLAKHEVQERNMVQVHRFRPRSIKHAHVFHVLIHIDAVEDLLFYHHPREELVQDGKVPWREFMWQFGRVDGNLDEEDLHPPTRHCEQDPPSSRRRPRDDDDEGDYHKAMPRSFMSKISGCMEGRGRSRERQQQRGRTVGWALGESSRGRTRKSREVSESPSRDFSPAERRALRGLWNDKKINTEKKATNQAQIVDQFWSPCLREEEYLNSSWMIQSDAIEIVPQDDLQGHARQVTWEQRYKMDADPGKETRHENVVTYYYGATQIILTGWEQGAEATQANLSDCGQADPSMHQAEDVVMKTAKDKTVEGVETVSAQASLGANQRSNVEDSMIRVQGNVPDQGVNENNERVISPISMDQVTLDQGQEL